MHLRITILLFAGLLAGQANATCDDTTLGCDVSAVQAAEHELEARFQQLRNQLGSASLPSKRLVNAQRTWRTFRDAECELVTAYRDDKGRHAQDYERCSLSMIEQRMQALEHYQQCAGSDQDCTVDTP